jgi:hypothetical protein
MKARVTFKEIWDTDAKIRLLAGGMLADGMLMFVIAVLAVAFIVL